MMNFSNRDNFNDEKICAYKNEIYSVRDNGAVMRHQKKCGRVRKI